MKIVKVAHPYRKFKVKQLPRDAEYRQQDVNDNEIYYSKYKEAYYVVIK